MIESSAQTILAWLLGRSLCKDSFAVIYFSRLFIEVIAGRVVLYLGVDGRGPSKYMMANAASTTNNIFNNLIRLYCMMCYPTKNDKLK